MKKGIAYVLVLILMCAVFAGCGSSNVAQRRAKKTYTESNTKNDSDEQSKTITNDKTNNPVKSVNDLKNITDADLIKAANGETTLNIEDPDVDDSSITELDDMFKNGDPIKDIPKN